jgi:transposase-like protein
MLRVADDRNEHEHAARDQAGDDEREGEPAEVVGLDELCRLAARDMIATALEAERRAYLEAHGDQFDENGRRLVVGNGHARPREVTTAAGRVEVSAPRMDDRRDGEKFTSALLPPYMRKTPKVAEVFPILYLRGMSTGDFTPALEGFFG